MRICQSKISQCVVIVIVLSLLTGAALCQPVTYTYTGKVSVTFRWDHVKDANFHHYDVQLLRLDQNDNVVETFVYETTNTTISIVRPRAGTYIVRVRAVNQYQNMTFMESEWCSSSNPACALLKDGTAGEWRVKWKLSSPLIIGPITTK